MATTKILLKRGVSANFGSVTLEPGEPAFLTDTGKLYVGGDSENILINGGAASKEVGTDVGDLVEVQENGKIDPSVIPAAAITEVYVVADKTARLALTDVHPGDVAVEEDTHRSYILEAEPATEESNWVELTAAGYVTSVNQKTGDVVIGIADIAGLTDDLADKAPLDSPAFTGAPCAPTPAPGDDSTNLATTAFVQDALATDAPVLSVNEKVGIVVVGGEDIVIANYIKATVEEPLEVTDTVNEALGKLEKCFEVIDGGTF